MNLKKYILLIKSIKNAGLKIIGLSLLNTVGSYLILLKKGLLSSNLIL